MKFPTLSTNRLEAPRRVSHPTLGFLGTIQKNASGWYATDANERLLGNYSTARAAREALESVAA
jgi:hypothetical protein